jgi:phosphopantothenoylcysteine decarboxylase / phosphopantothenate---cysteine ligase
VSGPVNVEYPAEAHIVPVVTTDEMLVACRREFQTCQGVIGAAAPCDYRPEHVLTQKMAKTGEPLVLHLQETEDIIASLGAEKKGGQWVVGFALETEDQRFRALVKLEKKSCDLIVLNGPAAMNSLDNAVEVLDKSGTVIASLAGSKTQVAHAILQVIQLRLMWKE